MSEIDTSSGGGIADRLARLKLQAEHHDSANSHSSPRAPPPSRMINEAPFSPIGPKPSTPRRPSQAEETDEHYSLTKLRPTVILTTAFPTKRERPPPPPIPSRGSDRAPPPPPPSHAPAAAGRNRSPPPPPPSQPPAAARRNTSPPPPPPPSQPPAAARRTVTAPPPPLHPPANSPPRLPARKTSNASLNSIASAHSTRSLPPVWTGKEALPIQLPERKANGMTTHHDATAHKTIIPPLPPRLPPRRPTGGIDTTRKPSSQSIVRVGEEEETPPPTPPRPQPAETVTPRRRLPPPPSTTLPPPPPLPSLRLNKPNFSRPPSPPPIPLTSRPKPPPLPSHSRPPHPSNRPTSRPTPPLSPSHEDPICLRCRDFTLADTLAAAPHLSRTSVPSLKHLATALSAPFPNSTLDIARAIFTWLHHNIAYDTAAFFGNAVRAKSPQDTLSTGLAVCQGYAELFVELARLGGGIDPAHVKLVSGGSKGFGHRDLQPGDPLPEYRASHAWNAVYIPELGRWHLLDACWGAGHVTGPPNAGYHKKFNPGCFTASVEEFGRRHWPENPADQFVPAPLSWEEFVTLEMREGKGPRVCSDFKEGGWDERAIVPKRDRLDDEFISRSGGKVVFEFRKTCQHVPVDLARERLYIVTIEGVDEQWVVSPPARAAERGSWAAVTWSVTVDFWQDPKLRGVCMDGRRVRLMCFRDVDGRDATGMTGGEWAGLRGRVGYVLTQAVEWNAEG